MKKTLSLILALVLALSLLTTAFASDSTYRWQLGSRSGKVYDLLAAYLPYGYDSFSGDFSEPIVFADGDEANAELSGVISAAYDAFLRDYPEVFWLSKSGFGAAPSYYADENGVYITGLTVRVDFIASDVSSMQSELNAAVNSILSAASGSDYDKVLYFHDAIISRCSYAYDAVSSYSQPLVYESYGALVDGYALCEGYAKAFKLLCNRAGIPCESIIGTENGRSHMWNYVKLDGSYYHMDVTFDDTTSSYAYFLKGRGSVSGYAEGGSFLSDSYTGLYYPAISPYDYSGASTPSAPPADAPASSSSSAQEPSADPSASSEEPTDPSAQAPAEEEPWQPQPPQLPLVEEGFCRVTVDHYKNGKVLIKAADRPGFVKQGEILPKGTVLQIIALPDAGYGIGAVNVVSETAIHTDDGRMLTVTLEESCSVGVLFGELSSAQSAAE